MKKRNIFFVIIFFAFLLKGLGQPDRMWSVSFNTEASMLAGAVVGDNSDITSLYYNPAGISQIEDQKLVLNANLFRVDFESYKGYMGDNTSSQDWGFRVQPRFVSYTMRSKKIKKLSYQFGVFNRNYESKSIYAQEKEVSHYHMSNVGETTIRNYDYKSDYADYWGGLGLSYQLSEKLSLGVSLLASFKSFSYDKNMFVIISPDRELMAEETPFYAFNFNSYERVLMYDDRLTAKLGAKYKLDQWAIGVNISLPSVHVLGNADVKRKIELTNFPNEEGISETSFKNEFSQYRIAGFKDPFSIAFGFVYYSKNKRSQYYFSSEYFKGDNTYLVIDGMASISPKLYTEGTDFTSYKFGTRDIVNLAVGYKRLLSDNFDLILGFKTDVNAYSVSNENKFMTINELDKVHNNLYHFTVGSNFNWKQASFILGFANTFGSLKNTNSLMKVNGVEEQELLFLGNGTMDYLTISFGLFLGFSFGF